MYCTVHGRVFPLAVFPLDSDHLHARQHKQPQRTNNRTPPRHTPNIVKPRRLIEVNVHNVVHSSQNDVGPAQAVESRRVHARDIGCCDGCGEEREGFEAVFGGVSGAEDALFLLHGYY